ncbi:FAD binding domain-containing protein [Mumia sp. DW29H23]|uniref:FAD binding domain-containing protein n=1 Tax=Mumia sp. DW29H23 TaxID=3421241 RepID=UPI003D69F3F0
MDLVDVQSVVTPLRREDLADWRAGDAVLAGGTFLFSEPQPGVRRLVDVTRLAWAPLVVHDDGLEIAATCTLGTLAAAAGDTAPLLRRGGVRARATVSFPDTWTFGPIVRDAVDALVASFKVWHTATVGGNVCLALPAGSMTSLLAGLGADATVWSPDGTTRTALVADLVTGVGTTALAAGEVVRSFFVPRTALVEPVAFRRVSLSVRGRSAAVVVARRTVGPDGTEIARVTVTGATPRPYVLTFPAPVDAATWHAALDASVPASDWLGDVHGAADWRRHASHLLGLDALRSVGGLR